MSQELRELRAKAVEADGVLTDAIAALREAALAVNTLALVVDELKREALDCEFETIAAEVRVHLDGRLLQRTGYVSSRVAQASLKLRELADGVKHLRQDCADMVPMLPAPEDPHG